MPIGVPKVEFEVPGDPEPQWVDLYNRLYRDRLLFMGQELDNELSNQLCGILLYLNAEDEDIDHILYINSPGGAIVGGLAVFDMMNVVDSSVTTMCIGTAASMASLVLAGGEPGMRIALPHSRHMIHQPEGGSRGQTSDVMFERVEVIRLRKMVVQLYMDRTNQDEITITTDLSRDVFMNADDAKAYGLVDRVSRSSDDDYPESGGFPPRGRMHDRSSS